VADYGQLELRILAHMTKCLKMIQAFRLGGDFHSRTAIGMFQEIKDKVDNGEVLIEWDYSKGTPNKPLLKDAFSNERKKAKIMNFSIAYGKTAHGFAKDWDVSL
jgi:DNA polymerase I